MLDYQGARKRVPLRERMDSILGRLPETTRTAMSPLLGGPQGVGILDVLPGTGEALAANDYVDAREAGDSLGQGIAALGVVPVVGAAGRGVGRGARAARAAAKAPRIRGWHGSPYEFERFDLSKIGTGEGAQAYGHGAYIGGREETGRFYRDVLTDPDQIKVQVGGRRIPSVWTEDLRRTFPDLYRGLSESDTDVMDTLLGTMESAYSINDAMSAVRSVGSRRAEQLFNQRIAPVLTKPDVGPGHLYEVDILASPDELLDWDVPLAQQPERVRKGYARALANSNPLAAELLGDLSDPASLQNRRWLGSLFPNSRGSQAYNTLADGNAAEASRRLLDAGVPGIRYLDGNSRAAGEGSHNYVVFDADRIEILRRYGLLPPAMVATQQAMQDRQPPRRQEPPRRQRTPTLDDMQRQLQQMGY